MQTEQTVADFIRENFYSDSMDTEEFIWSLIAKVSDFADKDTLRKMYLADVDMEEIAALALNMS